MLWTPAFLRGSRTELQKPDSSKGFTSHLQNPFTILQDNGERGDKKFSNTSNTETQQSSEPQVPWTAVWSSLSVCLLQPALSSTKSEWAPAFVCASPRVPGVWKLFVLSKNFRWNQADYSCFAEVQKRLHKARRELKETRTGIWSSEQTLHASSGARLGSMWELWGH